MIRYDGMVLAPTGEFSAATGPGTDTTGLLWWHYLLIAAGAVLLVALCAMFAVIIVRAVVTRNKTSPYREALKVQCCQEIKTCQV